MRLRLCGSCMRLRVLVGFRGPLCWALWGLQFLWGLRLLSANAKGFWGPCEGLGAILSL